MKKLFFSVVALCMTMTISADEVTVDLAAGKHDGSKITWMVALDNIAITQNQGESTSPVNSNYISAPRMYQGHYLGFECTENYTINKVEITYNGTYTGSDITVGTQVVDKKVVDNTAITRTFGEESGASHVFTSASGLSKLYIQNSDTLLKETETQPKYKQLRPTAIKITYTKAATTEPTITAANEFDLGTVASAAAFESKVLKVVGENLTALTYAIKEENPAFAVTGTLAAVGGDLTIACTATVAGTHTATLVLTGTPAVTKEVTLTATILDVEGDGTKDNPFTVADVLKLSNVLGTSQQYWVKGIILGAVNNEDLVSNVNSNIVLGATKDAVHPNWVPVQLKSGDARVALNIVDNPSNVGREVNVLGTLEPYFNLPGVKGVETADQYVLGEQVSALDNVSANETKAVKVIENGQIFIIKEGVKYNIFGAEVD